MEIVEVTAHATTRGRPITPNDVLPAPRGNGIIAGDNITASLQFDNGVTGTLLQHKFDRINLDAHVVELYGTEGRLMWHPHGAWKLNNPHVVPQNGPPNWEALTPIYPDSFAEAVKQISQNSEMIEGDYWFVEEYVRALDEGHEHITAGTNINKKQYREIRNIVYEIMSCPNSIFYLYIRLAVDWRALDR